MKARTHVADPDERAIRNCARGCRPAKANYYSLHDALSSLGLAAHLVERLAQFLLFWTSTGNDAASTDYRSFKLPRMHQEIADSIGLSTGDC